MATAPVSPAPLAPVTSAPVASPTPPTRRARRGAGTTPPVRVAYTRHATAGSGDDRIVHPIVVVLAWAGGIALLCWVLFGGFQWGRATSLSGGGTTPSAPQVIVVPQSQPVTPPSVTTQPSQRVELPQLTDAERRNEALKERLRRRYGI